LRLLFILLAIAVLLTAADAELQRGVKDYVEDVVLLGADDWHYSIAATPLSTWSEENRTVIKPQLILPKDVQAGERMGWVEQSDLETYGVQAILHTFKSANVSSFTIHGSGDLAKSMVEAAHKEALKAYLTATLEVPKKAQPKAEKLDVLALEPENQITSLAERSILQEVGLAGQTLDQENLDPSLLQVPSPDLGGNATQFCPVNPEVREELYSQIEILIDDYKADGVVLYSFGFQDENYCFCDFCAEKFYKDTGIDLSKVSANSYNLERWRQWKQDQIMSLARAARNITSDLGPVSLGVALGNPFDRSQGYNFAELSQIADFSIIAPLSTQDARLATGISQRPVYMRLNDDYVQHVINTQNVEGTVKYIEDLNSSGISGFAFEYNVVYTPLWSELEPPSNSARWLLQQLGGTTLGIGNVSWKCSSTVSANSSFQMAEKLSRRWKSSPGAVLVGENYSAGLVGAEIASYMNWPVLFVNDTLPPETASALRRLGAKEVVMMGAAPELVKKNISELNISLTEGDSDLLLNEMKVRGESPNMVILVNSRDLSLIPPIPRAETKRDLVGDLMVSREASTTHIPAEIPGEVVRLNISLINGGSKTVKNIHLIDLFAQGRLIKGPRASQGKVNVTDPYSGRPCNPENAIVNGSFLRWDIGELEPDKSASLVLEAEILYALDAGWKQHLDEGPTVAYEGLTYNVTTERKDDPPIVNITYPSQIIAGMANISWEIEREASYMAFNIYSPDGRVGGLIIHNPDPSKRHEVRLPLIKPGAWRFNIEMGDGYPHRTDNLTIQVVPGIPPLNITAFSHTMVPRLSLVAAQAAAARKALLVDVAKDPQDVDPLKVEEDLAEKIEDLNLSPEYLLTVGDPGSLPFISTGLRQFLEDPLEYGVYRDYLLESDDDNYTEVATGRIVGLSVYDASQLLARTLAYDRLKGAWKDQALVIYSPPLSFPQSPIPISIRDYLMEAGLKVTDLSHEEATYQAVTSQMNNGQNIVAFDHHGNEEAWGLSTWSMMDSRLTEAHVKLLTLSPQTTTSSACVTANLKGLIMNLSGTEMYIPRRLEDSIALAFIRAGAVNYIGESALSWIFLSEDYHKRFYQALIFENATVGQAEREASNLFQMKLKGASDFKKNLSEYDEVYPPWDTSIQEMLNQTIYMGIMLGDPSFRPYLPQTPPLPYSESTKPLNETSKNKTLLEADITPQSEQATDWIYWIEEDTTGGKPRLNAPSAIIAKVMLPKDADNIVVKENGLAVWHDEDTVGSEKSVMWPVVRPKLGEERTFTIEYSLVPGLVQVINVTAGWNAISIYLKPKDSRISKHLKNKPYRSVFSASGEEWNYSLNDIQKGNVTDFEAGRGYLIDSIRNFTVEIQGKPVELPYYLQLEQGWNLVGLPMNATMSISNLTVNAEHKRYKYQEAVEKGLVSAFLWSYDGSVWQHLGNDTTLEPGKAYLLEAKSECRLDFR
jgi:hypothetical protein